MIKFLVLSGLSFFSPEIKKDSIGLETINGKVFIVHKVDAGETLYAISKRYGVTIEQIVAQNPSADGGLEVDQILKVPYVPRTSKIVAQGKKHVVAEKETLFSISRLYGVTVDELKKWNNLTDNALSLGQELVIKTASLQANNVETMPRTAKVTHTVAAKETMYSITRQYGITVEQLREWNGLQNDELKVGQTLFVSQPVNANQITATQTITQVQTQTNPVTQQATPVIEKINVPITTPAEKTVTPPAEKTTTIKISENVNGTDEVRETGLAELIEGTEGNRKYLALHRTAPSGTILKIRNEMNNREVFVRVMGKLPETAPNDKLVIKISKSAYDKLGAIDQRFRVEVTYYK
ncbi:MAG TPA: LysM peptidoglycan-binding domain-containing protein [Cyclobacteriaceae bacterium]|nr:LysM peptidoglycan-binding domain-containing protein [Cyclobacteriaceae bacterium]HMV08795.1 LysM peptidoglycan-binding domain-containing protein [Cyclobacteriaceae bacterium]HMV90531.1 LysM peptidoglycan-binding domain-containing protein [Cyclobacteriaceae bacterium]HMW99941.1 LysM peptidoglycan-binding domain-containing protein [Cyclobacteriaceae bacterium]HMX49196.1 LysM peptidoglycan-binding domain-containing protein [Cyclobacteriaceae bacterium]